MFVAIHLWTSNAAYRDSSSVQYLKPPDTGSGSFQRDPWNHMQPIMTRMNHVATCPRVR